MKQRRLPFYRQPDQMDCGATCIKMVAKYYGRTFSLEKLRRMSETTRIGSNLKFLADTAERIGLRSLGVKINFERLKDEATLPVIVHWQQYHFVVVYKIKNDQVIIADPAHGIVKLSKQEFIKGWTGESSVKTDGVVLLLEPTPDFKNQDQDQDEKRGFGFLYKYLFTYKKFLVQLVLGLMAGSLLQLVFPFLTQSIVDIGIENRDLSFIYLILLAQLFLFIGRATIDVIRGWILLHLSTRINISLVSDYFIKLMKLPIAYFDTKLIGDLMQRISDHQRVESLLTTTSLNVLFSLFNLVIFGFVLAFYSVPIFLIFLAGSVLYLVWIVLFLKRRKVLDYKRFDQLSNEQSKIIELINGMQEIKLHNAEREKRWGWERLQAKLFKIETKTLALTQFQTIGSGAINEVKNIFITVYSAQLVIEGNLTLGMMLAISYITGQLNAPLQQFVNFILTAQDAKIALERLSEIHEQDDEENILEKVRDIKSGNDIKLETVSFRYQGALKNVLNNLSLTIPSNKITAIVGASGSGKTTLMKILLKFYDPQEGKILYGNHVLSDISQYKWRDMCGVVMQEGFIFNDTIANNIAIGENEEIEIDRIHNALEIASIAEFVNDLPMGINTKIGMDGVGMSTGQKQRILIARAVYKNPSMICFDEATSALDAKNERIIMQNLNVFFKDRTAVVIAHRLSTVKNADQIVVLDKGEIVEVGTHESLLKEKGSYYALVKNQLELEKLDA